MSVPPENLEQAPAPAESGAGLVRRIAKRLVSRRDGYADVRYRGVVLPPRELRMSMCGGEYSDDRVFWESGRAEARRLVSELGYRDGMEVVDLGAGLGRLARGLVNEVGEVSYHGFDVVADWVEWCRVNIEWSNPSFRFLHLDVRSELYNPGGAVEGGLMRLPLRDGHADIVYAWGLFTNLDPDSARVYASEIGRILRPGGRVFLTAFVEEDVPDVTVNPVDYVDYPLTEPLHVVRWKTAALRGLFAEHGLVVDRLTHHAGVHCNQSELYLTKVSPDGA